jgi:hypothetical protein
MEEAALRKPQRRGIPWSAMEIIDSWFHRCEEPLS